MTAHSGVRGIVIRTDRSVNCATLDTIAADVTRGCRTEQERAVAIYDLEVGGTRRPRMKSVTIARPTAGV